MNDLISRQQAINALRAMQTYKLFAGDDMLLIDQAEAQTELMMLPSAKPTIEPKSKGEWVYGEHDAAMCDGYRCNHCGFFVPWDYKYTFIDFIKDYHFCPNCGAKMKGERKE